MENPKHYGLITCLCIDRKRAWVVCGTATGVLSLWDLRFGILIRSWKAGVSASHRSPRIYQCHVHPTKGKGRWIVVAMETESGALDADVEGSTQFVPLVEVWDIEKMSLVETFGARTAVTTSPPVAEPKEVPGSEAEKSPAAAIAALVRARQDEMDGNQDILSTRRRSSLSTPPLGDLPTLTPSPDVRALIVGAEFGGHGTLHRSAMGDVDGAARPGATRGFMLCGSEDRKIRLWDLSKPERSTLLCGPEGDGEKPIYRQVH